MFRTRAIYIALLLVLLAVAPAGLQAEHSEGTCQEAEDYTCGYACNTVEGAKGCTKPAEQTRICVDLTSGCGSMINKSCCPPGGDGF